MVSAIILAGGRGKRMGKNISKQYILVNEKPVLYYTIKRFLECESIDNIVLVLPKDEIDYCKREVLVEFLWSILNDAGTVITADSIDSSSLYFCFKCFLTALKK